MSDSITRKEFNKVLSKLTSDLDVKLDAKVSWKHFTWIISTILGLYVVATAAVWQQARDNSIKIDQNTSINAEINSDVSYIKGLFSNLEFINIE